MSEYMVAWYALGWCAIFLRMHTAQHNWKFVCPEVTIFTVLLYMAVAPMAFSMELLTILLGMGCRQNNKGPRFVLWQAD